MFCFDCVVVSWIGVSSSACCVLQVASISSFEHKMVLYTNKLPYLIIHAASSHKLKLHVTHIQIMIINQ